MFDEQPDGDPHGECAAEIDRLKQLADSEGTRAVMWQRRAVKMRRMLERVRDWGVAEPELAEIDRLIAECTGQSDAALGNRTPARQEERPDPDALHGQIMNLPTRGPTGTIHTSDYLIGHRDARHAAAELVAAFASSGPSEKEVGAAPLPVQGQDGAMVKQPYCIEGLVAAVAVGDNPEVAAIFDTPAQAHGFVNYLKRFIEPSPAALRASSAAPTTKG